MAVEDRGFASMSKAKQTAIASLGGKAAHAKGTAYEWDRKAAIAAGRKGGIATQARRMAAREEAAQRRAETAG